MDTISFPTTEKISPFPTTSKAHFRAEYLDTSGCGSFVNYSSIDESCPPCVLCQKRITLDRMPGIIQRALHRRYSTGEGYYYLNGINNLVKKKRTAEYISYKDNKVYDKSEELLRRVYKNKEFAGKFDFLWKFHQFTKHRPGIFAQEIYVTLLRNYHSKRRLHEKAIKRMLDQLSDSELENMEINIDDYMHQTHRIIERVDKLMDDRVLFDHDMKSFSTYSVKDMLASAIKSQGGFNSNYGDLPLLYLGNKSWSTIVGDTYKVDLLNLSLMQSEAHASIDREDISEFFDKLESRGEITSIIDKKMDYSSHPNNFKKAGRKPRIIGSKAVRPDFEFNSKTPNISDGSEAIDTRKAQKIKQMMSTKYNNYLSRQSRLSGLSTREDDVKVSSKETKHSKLSKHQKSRSGINFKESQPVEVPLLEQSKKLHQDKSPSKVKESRRTRTLDTALELTKRNQLTRSKPNLVDGEDSEKADHINAPKRRRSKSKEESSLSLKRISKHERMNTVKSKSKKPSTVTYYFTQNFSRGKSKTGGPNSLLNSKNSSKEKLKRNSKLASSTAVLKFEKKDKLKTLNYTELNRQRNKIKEKSGLLNLLKPKRASKREDSKRSTSKRSTDLTNAVKKKKLSLNLQNSNGAFTPMSSNILKPKTFTSRTQSRLKGANYSLKGAETVRVSNLLTPKTCEVDEKFKSMTHLLTSNTLAGKISILDGLNTYNPHQHQVSHMNRKASLSKSIVDKVMRRIASIDKTHRNPSKESTVRPPKLQKIKGRRKKRTNINSKAVHSTVLGSAKKLSTLRSRIMRKSMELSANTLSRGSKSKKLRRTSFDKI